MDGDSSATLLADAREVCSVVTSALGPFGANKFIVQDNGTVTLSASGSEVLERCDLNEPAVELLRTAAAGFRDEHRDGTTRLVALVGALLEEAVDLRELGLHPTAIERGYRTGLEVAQEYVASHTLPAESVETEAIARTALTAIRDPGVRNRMGTEVAGIAGMLWEEAGDEPFDRRNVTVVSRVGGSLAETRLVQGVVLPKGPVLESTSRDADGGIALVSSAIDVARGGGEMGRRPGLTLRLSPESFEERQAFDEFEQEQFDEHVSDAIDAGCRVVLTTASVNDRVKRTLSNRGLLAFQRIDEDEMRRLARGTGATIVGSFAEIPPDALGSGRVSVRREAGKDMTLVEATSDRIYTVFCRGPDPRTLSAFTKSVESAVAAVTTANRAGNVVPGGGTVEIGAAGAIRDAGHALDGRAQFAVETVGRALTVVPRTLARTGGLDGSDAVIRLRNAHTAGESSMGIDAHLGEVVDVIDTDDPLVEPAETTVAIWESAVDLAVQMLRIDERLLATDLSSESEREASTAGE
jgi:chaperonin GroEL (HSP60 family)